MCASFRYSATSTEGSKQCARVGLIGMEEKGERREQRGGVRDGALGGREERGD